MKNMIKFTKTVFFLLLVFNLQAQKVKLKDFKVQAEHVNIPYIGFGPEVTTYDCQVECNEDALKRYNTSPTAMGSRITIKGYNKVEGGGSVSVVLNMGTPNSSARETVTQSKEDKDKKKYNLYNYYFDLNVEASYRIADANGNIIHENNVVKKERLSTKQFNSMAALIKQYKNDYPAAKTNAMSKLVSSAVTEINRDINNKFSVGKTISNEFFVGIKSKSHPDVKKFDKIRTTVEEAFKKMKAESNEDFLMAIQPAVEFWVEKESGYSTKDKQEKKLNYACRKNAALAYYWMDDFDNAIKYAKMIEDGDHNAKKGKKLKNGIINVQERMKKLNYETRHFAVKVSEEDQANLQAFNQEQEEIYGSGDISRYPEFNKTLNVKVESTVAPGKMFHKTGKVSEGYFVYEPEEETPPFWYSRKIRFGMDENGKIKKGNPVYKGLDSLLIGDIMYRVKPVRLGEGLISMKLKNGIIEEVKNFKKTRLEIVHPPFEKAKGIAGSEMELESTLAIWHFEKEKHFSPDGLSFYKSMKKAVGDCPASLEYLDNMKKENKKKKLLAKLADSSYDVEDLHNILNLYDTCN